MYYDVLFLFLEAALSSVHRERRGINSINISVKECGAYVHQPINLAHFSFDDQNATTIKTHSTAKEQHLFAHHKPLSACIMLLQPSLTPLKARSASEGVKTALVGTALGALVHIAAEASLSKG